MVGPVERTIRCLPAARPVQAAGDQQLPDAASPDGRVDDEHPEGGFVVGPGHLAEFAAEDQRDATDHAPGRVPHDQQVGAGRPAGHVGQLGRVAGRREFSLDVDPHREFRDPVEVLGIGRLDGDEGSERDHVRRVNGPPTYARRIMTTPTAR
jgi:hypothetical protein